MPKPSTLSALGVVAACAIVLAAPASAQTQPGGGGPGMMGPGMMGPGMMGPGMMGPGMMGPGMMGPNGCACGMMWGQRGANVNLSVSDVRGNLEQWLQRNRNRRLKVGRVVATDANTITADVVMANGGALVERYVVDRHSGYYRPGQ